MNNATPEQLRAALQGLMEYVGGWDAPAGHPCRIAADLLNDEAAPELSPVDTFLEHMAALADAKPQHAEFLHRLAGNVRKVGALG